MLFSYGPPIRGCARGLWLVTEGRLCFYFWGHPKDLHVDIKGGIGPDRWHQVVATFDGKAARLYYDGKLVGHVEPRIDTKLRGRFQIGANLVEDGRDFLGLMDDIAVYSRAVTAAEIRAEFERKAAILRTLTPEQNRAYYAKLQEHEAAQRARLAEQIGDLGVEDIVFAVRQPGKDGHWYANFGYWSFAPDRTLYGDGGRLCRLNLRTGKLTALLDDPRGGVRDPQVHYDGKTILFSYRKGGQPYYHLYEVQAHGTGLRQLTDGPFDDIEPTYLPDGDIVFCSSRCKRWVPCWSTHVAILHRCDRDGGNIHSISSNIEHENTPAVLPDGRVLYTRWEYVDRSQVDYHHLWTFNPDGTGQMTYFGNMHPGTVMIDAVPIPGTQSVVASFSPGHGRREHAGAVTIVDPRGGPDARGMARRISRGHDFHDPYPLTAERFLVARGASLLLMDARGATTTLYSLPQADRRRGLWCHEPRPLRARPRERVIPPRVAGDKATGRLILVDAAFGRRMGGVKRGQIRKLLVLESLPKPVNFNMPGHPTFQISHMEPLSIGGTFTLARVLGTVPVEPDGSAHFEIPALRSVFFVALDAAGLSVKRMQSFVTVQPGETTSCAGCHEPRTSTPPPSAELRALKRPPSRMKPFEGIPDVPDFPRDIQPILDKHCVKCHNPDRPTGKVDLCGDRTPCYSTSYWTIVKRRLISDARNGGGNRPPRSIGSSASRLLKYIDGSHHDARLSADERLRLILWIETGATYPGTYASYYCGMVRVKFPVREMVRRCGGCHRKGHPRLAWEGRDIRPWARLPLNFANAGPALSLCNLTRPEKSALLLSPLAKQAGGYGICQAKAGKQVLADAKDPDYQRILAAIRDASKELDRIKRFDMPAFRPNVHYIREMQRFGILPADLDPKAPVDPHAADQAYWRSLWYRPVQP